MKVCNTSVTGLPQCEHCAKLAAIPRACRPALLHEDTSQVVPLLQQLTSHSSFLNPAKQSPTCDNSHITHTANTVRSLHFSIKCMQPGKHSNKSRNREVTNDTATNPRRCHDNKNRVHESMLLHASVHVPTCTGAPQLSPSQHEKSVRSLCMAVCPAAAAPLTWSIPQERQDFINCWQHGCPKALGAVGAPALQLIWTVDCVFEGHLLQSRQTATNDVG